MAAIFYRVTNGNPRCSVPNQRHRRFQKWVAAGVFDKIEKEALKLYERSVKIKTKRMNDGR